MDGDAAARPGIRLDYAIGPLGHVDSKLLKVQRATEVDGDLEERDVGQKKAKQTRLGGGDVYCIYALLH